MWFDVQPKLLHLLDFVLAGRNNECHVGLLENQLAALQIGPLVQRSLGMGK